MSMYATIAGKLVYEDARDFVEAVDMVRPWLNDNDQFIPERRDETDEFILEPHIDFTTKTITIPFGVYRNLIRVLDSLCKSSKGVVVWASIDGCFDGGVIVDGKETPFDLHEWGKEHVLDEGEDLDDMLEYDMDEYLEATDDIINEFFDRYWFSGKLVTGGPPNDCEIGSS